MSYQKGSDFLLKCDLAGTSSYTTIAGIQNGRIRGGAELTDVTNQGSSSKMREALAGAAIVSLSVSGDGVLDSGATLTSLESLWRNQTQRNWQIVVPGLGTYTGAFKITQLEFGGGHSKEVTISISLESAGAFTIA